SIRRTPRSTLSPYPTLFRSRGHLGEERLRPLGPVAGSIGRTAVAQEHLARRHARLVERLEVFLHVEDGALDGAPFCAARHLRKRSEEHTSELQSREKLVCRL